MHVATSRGYRFKVESPQSDPSASSHSAHSHLHHRGHSPIGLHPHPRGESRLILESALLTALPHCPASAQHPPMPNGSKWVQGVPCLANAERQPLWVQGSPCRAQELTYHRSHHLAGRERRLVPLDVELTIRRTRHHRG